YLCRNGNARHAMAREVTSFRSRLFRHRPIYFPGTHNKALGRWANIVKREASDERQIVTGCCFQNLNGGGVNNLDGFHDVLETFLGSLKPNLVTHSNISKRAKKCVAVAS